MNLETRLRFYVDDAMIYFFYFGEFDLVRKFRSPFPHRGDSNPSFKFTNIGSLKRPKIIWTDFGMSGTLYRDGIGFVMEYYGLTRPKAVRKIWEEMVLDKKISLKRPVLKQPLILPYEYKYEDLHDFEMEYWNRLYFDNVFMKFFNVHSLKYLRRPGGNNLWSSTPENPTYLYTFSKKGAVKAYRPLDPNKDKFRGQNNGDILEGYDQLPPRGQHCFHQSSLKDTMTFRRVGYLGCNPTSENSRRAILSRVREFNQRFEHNYILFDNDEPGRKAALSLANITGWTPLFLPVWAAKDPSDLVMKTRSYFELSVFLSKFNLIKYHI